MLWLMPRFLHTADKVAGSRYLGTDTYVPYLPYPPVRIRLQGGFSALYQTINTRRIIMPWAFSATLVAKIKIFALQRFSLSVSSICPGPFILSLILDPTVFKVGFAPVPRYRTVLSRYGTVSYDIYEGIYLPLPTYLRRQIYTEGKFFLQIPGPCIRWDPDPD